MRSANSPIKRLRTGNVTVERQAILLEEFKYNVTDHVQITTGDNREFNGSMREVILKMKQLGYVTPARQLRALLVLSSDDIYLTPYIGESSKSYAMSELAIGDLYNFMDYHDNYLAQNGHRDDITAVTLTAPSVGLSIASSRSQPLFAYSRIMSKYLDEFTSTLAATVLAYARYELDIEIEYNTTSRELVSMAGIVR